PEFQFYFSTSAPKGTPFCRLSCHTSYIDVQCPALSVGSEKQIDKADDEQERHSCEDTESAACHKHTDLVDAQGNHICQQALISDGEKEPFRVVHLSLDRAHSSEAGSAQKVEHQEGVCRDSAHAAGKLSPELHAVFRYFRETVKDTKGSNHVFFCDQSGYSRNRHLPVAPS